MPGSGHSSERGVSRTKRSRHHASSAPIRGFLDLPIDIIRRVFRNLDSTLELCVLMEVCTKFSEAAHWSELWRRVKAVDPITRRAGEKDTSRLYRFITHGLDGVERSGPGKPKSAPHPNKQRGVGLAVDIITSRAGSQLESLDLQLCYPNFPRFDHQMTDNDLETISNRCSESLQSLLLSPSLFVTGPALVDLAKACPKLRTLHLTGCKNVTDKVLGAVVRACPKLEDISVSRCKGFRGEGLHARLSPVYDTLKRLDMSGSDLRSVYMATFMRFYPALEELDASNGFDVNTTGPVPSSEESLFPSLVKLNLGDMYISENFLKVICSECQTLRYLCVSSAFRDQDSSDRRFTTKIVDVVWPPLEYLNIAGRSVTDEMWQRLFEKLHGSLVQYDVSNNEELTCLLEVTEEQCFLQLEKLNISGTDVTDDNLRMLISLAPNLKSVNASGCPGIDRETRRNPLALRDSETSAEPPVTT